MHKEYRGGANTTITYNNGFNLDNYHSDTIKMVNRPHQFFEPCWQEKQGLAQENMVTVEEMKHADLTWGEITNHAQNRVRWRATVDAACASAGAMRN